MMNRLAFLLAAAVSVVAGAASAQDLAADRLLAEAVRPAPRTEIRLAQPYADAYAMRQAGIARTSIDRKLAGDDAVTGSLGFLCGLQPGAERSGMAAARGQDPNGRFLGAKVSLAFR
jgi:hypothetical protein